MSNEEIENTEAENLEPEVEITEDPAALLEDARNKADEHWNELLRARADMENLRRRQSRDLENAHKHALDKFINELLPVCDSMELGLNAAQADDASIDTVREGIEMTLKMFMSSIGKFGLEQVNPEGQTFDPELHQAMAMQEVEGVEANQVLTVAQKGYQFNGRLLRPAMVVVSQ
ncbi:nucleotide exchange factor GrpE [Methylophaga sp. 42_25_T18]|nr:nucleotide exchange factor GrpE [Methylophaga sp. 42_25_T18]OUR85877.1 nucleotide exchange factor GrpE [Methylophaga sp. 42_8_T64]